MKKPGVSNSKKGAIFNILWLLIENPHKLDYFRQADIKNQLIEEFGINLDRKTIQDYLDILGELSLLSTEDFRDWYNKEFKIELKLKPLRFLSLLSDIEI